MDRRQFLYLSGGLITIAACEKSTKKVTPKLNFPIHIDSNRTTGHLVKSAIQLPVTAKVTTETLVVGGGISGLAAACSLQSNDFIVCELNSQLGGTSSAISIDNVLYSQGAHYEHTYLHNYGQEGLQLLERLDIIQFNTHTNLWDFVDQQHLVAPHQEESCYVHGEMKSSVLLNSELRKNFFDLIHSFNGKLLLPSTLIPSDLYYLDHTTFYEYLNKYLPVDSTFINAIDYQMMDDYGGTTKQISALAGIHYYMCRPYYTNKNISLFSPTEGNYYFIDKMKNHIPSGNIQCNHLVFGLKKENKKWHVDIVDIKNMLRKKVIANTLIYSGQKHALQYTNPTSFEQFNDISYTPWVIINVVLNDTIELPNSKWQNDFISKDTTFLGFTDSKIQSKEHPRVLTAYYCFPDMHHYSIQNLETSYDGIVQQTLQKISTYYKKDITIAVKEVYIKLLGHAMPIPKPGYLTKSRNLLMDGMAFAGADTGRLPLLFDALDSGIQASRMVSNL
ncbi:NAD(P)/FAD-dependent oxidoreductase [Aquimarina sp. RZ0]|uniref:NAD(P)/FAD-dependent oxidoreductase n=1 Tax=Aquimarina sp. RZ0 TaxID=2607730 RepID=UPI0011F1CF39|nr:NAD(P)/FAD-dependent oxidoreductase [Aquimarina sp. RZ0]KAA1248027.1 FAD-dependent oxidoreductase [Aquimarina sp. RZ0]